MWRLQYCCLCHQIADAPLAASQELKTSPDLIPIEANRGAFRTLRLVSTTQKAARQLGCILADKLCPELHMSSLPPKAYTKPTVEQVEKLHAKNMTQTMGFPSFSLKYKYRHYPADHSLKQFGVGFFCLFVQQWNKFKFIPFPFSEKKIYILEMDSSPTPLLMRYFWVQTNTSSTYTRLVIWHLIYGVQMRRMSHWEGLTESPKSCRGARKSAVRYIVSCSFLQWRSQNLSKHSTLCDSVLWDVLTA